MDYKEAIQELKSRGSDRKEPALDSTVEALEALGRPDEDCQVVLVAGTNGKGSTVEMVSEGLQQLDLDVGTYRSPHLVSARERVEINGEMIPEGEFLDLYQEIDSLDLENELTFFEFMTVLAFLYFSKHNVDYAVMEIGMGGRLDATNAAEPELAVITNIDKDHTEYLGESRNQIAREKAGVIPENGKVVARDLLEPILETASERNSEILEPYEIEKIGDSYLYNSQKFSLPVKGSFQQENLETALRVIEELEQLPQDLESAFSGLECQGRMEIMGRMPTYIHDGAHNPAALRTILPDLPDGFICVFNALDSKDIEEMVSIIEQKASKFYLTKSSFFKAEDPHKIAEHVSIPHKIDTRPERAVEQALEEAGKDGAVVVTGSLYLIGDVKESRDE